MELAVDAGGFGCKNHARKREILYVHVILSEDWPVCYDALQAASELVCIPQNSGAVTVYKGTKKPLIAKLQLYGCSVL